MPRSGSGSRALAGREEELAVLRSRLRTARSGRAQVVVVEGPAGIGKSALIEDFVHREVAPLDVLWLRCDPLERDIAFATAELLLGEPVPAACSELEVARRLLTRLGDHHDSSEAAVLVVDDAHWMDSPTARAVRFALRRLRVEPLLAIFARRHGGPAPGLIAGEDAQTTTVLRPAPLDGPAIGDLARRTRGWTLSQATADRMLEETGGSPLLVSSVLRNAADQAQLEDWRDVPASVADATAQMLDSLDDESRRLVEAAAVLAEPADLVTLGGIAGVGEAGLRTGAAAAAGLVTLDRAGLVSTSHSLYCQAVYDALPVDRRQSLHERAARWTSGDRRLSHRAAALSRPDPGVVAELVAAADEARRSRRYDLAAAHRLRARSVSSDPAERDALLAHALIDRVSSQDLDAAEELAEQVAPLPPGPLRSLALGLLAGARGRVGEAKTRFQEAMTSATATGEVRVRQQAAVALAVLHTLMNEGALAVAALADIGDIEDPELACDAVATRGLGLWLVGHERGALRQMSVVRVSAGGSAWEAELLATRGLVHLFAGELPEARTDLDRSIAMFHLWRPSTNQPRIYVMRCLARYWLGDWDGSVGDAATARALASRAETWSGSLALACAASIDVPANRGQWEIAAHHLAEARAALAEVPPVAPVVDAVARHEASFYAARGEPDALLGLLEPLVRDDHLVQTSAQRSYRWVLPAWISTCVEVGRLDDAERDLRRYAALLRRWPGGILPDRLGWLRGLVAQARGEPDAALACFQADLADRETAAAPFVHARLRHAAGRLEQAAGRRREAIEHLTVAHDIFARLRAAPFLERCREDLAASGLRSSGTDPYALTPREEDVSVLVSRGFTNKEVARQLFVSPKAVEYHLRGIYAKLGITSRQELRRLRSVDRPWSEDALAQ